jgi:hypothetical protein
VAATILAHLIEQSNEEGIYAPHHHHGPKADIRERTNLSPADINYAVDKLSGLGALAISKPEGGSRFETFFSINKDNIRQLIVSGVIKGIDQRILDSNLEIPKDQDIIGLSFSERQKLKPEDNLLLTYTTGLFHQDFTSQQELSLAMHEASGLEGDELRKPNQYLISHEFIQVVKDDKDPTIKRIEVTEKGLGHIDLIAEKIGNHAKRI